MLTWKRQAKKVEGPVAYYRHWFSDCGHYRLTESVSKYEHGKGGQPLVRWYACLREEATGWWGIVSRHEKRATAQAACEAHAKAVSGNGASPKKTSNIARRPANYK